MTPSDDFVREATAPQSTDVLCILVTIEHDDLSETLYFVQDEVRPETSGDNAGITSNGNFHIAFPFRITLPNDRDQEVPRSTLRIDNVSREIIDSIRSISSSPTISINIARQSDPDTIERGPIVMTLEDVIYNAIVIQGNLGAELFLDTQYPYQKFTPNTAPGLFGHETTS